MKKKLATPLVLKDNSTSIYFDFEDEMLYEVKFKGALTSAFSGNQKSNTFFLSLIIIYLIAPVSLLLLNQFVFQNKLISLLVTYLLGGGIGYFLVKLVMSEIKEKLKVTPSAIELKRISKKSVRNGRVLNSTVVFFVLFSVIGTLISLSFSQQGFSKFLFYNTLSIFVIVGIITSSHPNRMIKAGKKLKKQMKEGNFDD
ncbi:hypothetical protein [Lactococcus lactis]|uniref:Tandem five-TM protein n=1 Tax=Lactococcus lactis TaxID=1358 RepID=A0A552Z014_9LACT|nr:hypothetical protein [Lactococcus lactis]MCT0078122.1 hypothetical protein [Lactococcus lactis subsp. lactis]MCT0442344.1 hypothetical protein [Lactococcus lactis subsp. lactis]MCT1179288.1 hypothetical protein [Lactococcus lactis]TRW72857.1 hypothetical protein FNJ53_09725 [Lactococcus lactis]